MIPLITVFTPTYNRKDLIKQCFKSLQMQTSYNFCWLIIDDGSTDGTDKVIKEWMRRERRFRIIYDYKDNGGLHTAYNRAIELAKTDLFVCIDSDDWMPNNAIEKIEILWSKILNKNFAGIMGMDCYKNGDFIGDVFPDNVESMYLWEKLTRYKIIGDKKIVHRTHLLKQVAPMPSFKNEKFFNPSYLMYQVDRFGKLYVTNDCFCIVDYQADGMSSNIYRQYRNSPNSYAETRKLYLSFPETSFSFKIRQYIHYTSSCILAHKFFKGLTEVPNTSFALFAAPFGLLLSGLVLFKTRK